MSGVIDGEQSLKILLKAKESFPRSRFEYKYGGNGADADENGLLEIDCSHMVHQALKQAGLDFSYDQVQTAFLNSTSASRYYFEVPSQYVIPGDLIIFRSHVGIVESSYWDSELGCLRGQFFHSESHSGGPTTTGFVDSPTSDLAGYKDNYYGSKKQKITRFLRPRKLIHKQRTKESKWEGPSRSNRNRKWTSRDPIPQKASMKNEVVRKWRERDLMLIVWENIKSTPR